MAGGRSESVTTRRRLWASKSPGKVVAHYADGALLKGYTSDFDPGQSSFHVVFAEDPDSQAVEVRVDALKALFFVRSFEGDPEYSESKDLYVTRPPGTRKIRVEFADGEELTGYVTRYNPGGPGFVFFPLDPRSNNTKVFAASAAVTNVTRLL
jgi:Family of unknown function (DUF6982)